MTHIIASELNNNLVGDCLLEDSLLSQTLSQALETTHNLLINLATAEDFSAKMSLSFGDSYNTQEVKLLAQDWANENFSSLPRIEIRSASEINGAKGAFASTTNTIYLSREFLSQNATNSQAISNVLLEEIGHYMDSRINTSDATGDEGAIFASLVQGENLSEQKLQLLKTEDDSAIIQLNGQQIIIEQSASDLQNWANSLQEKLSFLNYDFTINGQEAKFTNITIDVGEFFDSFLTSVFLDVNRIVNPVRPLLEALTKNIDFLTNPLPNGIEARALLDYEKEVTPNDVTLLDLLKAFGDFTGKFELDSTITFIKSANNLLNFIDFVSTIQSTKKISLGSFVYNLDAPSINTNSLASNIYSQISALLPGFDSQIKNLPGLSLPVLSDSNKIAQLLVGDSTSLFTYQMPEFKLSATDITFLNVPIVPPLFAKGRVKNIQFDSNLAFGFDTEGLRNLGNGFYVSDRENPDGTGLDIPEFTFSSAIGIGLSLDAGLIEANGEGVISGGAAFNLRDPNNDGKIRINEFSTQLFDPVQAEITASLSASLKSPSAYFFNNILSNPINAVSPVGSLLVDLAKREGGWIGEAGEWLGQKSKVVVNKVEKFFNWLGEGYEEITGQEIKLIDDKNKPSDVILQLNSPSVTLWSSNNTSSNGNSAFISKNPSLQSFTDGNDVRFGSAGKDNFFALGGNDELHGEAGDDRLDGGTGDDTLYGDADNDKLYGNQGNDWLYGGIGTDLLVGEGDKDWLLGGDGDDRLIGGDGSDVALYPDAPNGVEVDLNTGTAKGSAGNDVLVSIEEVIGSAKGDTLIGDDKNNYLSGGFGDDFFEDRGGNDTINAGSGNDFITPGLGNDQIFGGEGFDIVMYGSHSPSGLFVDFNAGTISGGLGNDTFQSIEGVFASYDDDILIGNSNANWFKGIDGNDKLIGYEGNDTLEGNKGDDWLNGGTGDDQINGGEGFDSVTYEEAPFGISFDYSTGTGIVNGGYGNDIVTFVEAVYGSNYGDYLIGRDNSDYRYKDYLYGNDGLDWLLGGAGSDYLDGGNGYDYVTYEKSTLGLGVEVYLSFGLSKGGSAGDDILVNIEGVFGSAFSDRLFGNDLNNELYGGYGNGNDYLDGGTGDDFLRGDLGNGNDYLDGGAGIDVMWGGKGNDIYIVDEATDLVNEIDGNGNDQVMSTVSYILPNDDFGIEALVLLGSNPINGTGNFSDNYLEGNDAVNVLTGNAGNDQLNGKAGNDQLFGNDGNDELDGGIGNDIMNGGMGFDIYIVDTSGDIVIEQNIANEIDTVQSYISYTLGDNTEELWLLGTSAIDGQGNNLDNFLLGNNAENNLKGEGGNDTLSSDGGNDKLDGGTGNDLLDGGTGDDELKGEDGDDSLLANDGNDSLDGGNGNDFLRGDNGNDVLTGGDGNDVIRGGIGSNTLTGGLGADIFEMDEPGVGPDTIEDFNSSFDDIYFYSFPNIDLSNGSGSPISNNQFRLGSTALDSDDRLIYDRSTGGLFFDQDGIGELNQTLVATLSNKASLSASDIYVF